MAKRRIYYTLAVREDDGVWAPQFGDYDRDTVRVELDDWHDRGRDCDTASEPGRVMHQALYDLYQTSEQLHDGDEFVLDGRPLYVCTGVEVIPL